MVSPETHLFWGQKVKGEDNDSQKHCRRGSLHPYESWLLLVDGSNSNVTMTYSICIAAQDEKILVLKYFLFLPFSALFLLDTLHCTDLR